MRKEIGADIMAVQWGGPEIGKPRVDGLGLGLYEVRTQCEGNAYRVIFTIHQDRMILLHGFMKKTRKTPAHDLALARERQKEVER